jgi:dihydropyrimidinase
MALVVRNGEIVTAMDRYVADIYCEDETITKIGKGLEVPPGTQEIDATGKYVFPGFIDPHTHIYLPFMGTYAKDDYTSASQAALIGGTTTIIEMICPSRAEEPLEAFELWKGKGEGKSACDFTFHMGVTKYEMGGATEAQLKEIVKSGLSSFKIFLAYKGAFGIDDTELYNTLKLAKKLGVITTAHCENDTAVLERQRELLAVGKTGPEYHHESRPPMVEAEGTHHLMSFAAMHDAHVYVVHLSCEEALAVAIQAKLRGVKVSVETLIQYLLIDKTYAEKADFEGAKYVMSPPLRDKKNQKVLWDGVASGLISTLATDHAPFDFATQKQMGRNDFTKIPNGIPTLEDRVNLFYTHGVTTGRISLNRFVDAASTQAAKLFDLFPRKGTIALGSDADLVIFDPEYRGKLSVKTQRQNVDYNAFEGWEIKGRPAVVTVRGKVAARDGKFVGEATRGKFLKREPSHF